MHRAVCVDLDVERPVAVGDVREHDCLASVDLSLALAVPGQLDVDPAAPETERRRVDGAQDEARAGGNDERLRLGVLGALDLRDALPSAARARRRA